MNDSIAIWGLAIVVFAHMIANFFKTPKEVNTELTTRVTAHEVAIHALEIRVEGTYSRHDEALENLTSAVEKLTDKFERWTERRNGER
jgi:hypothetical protein